MTEPDFRPVPLLLHSYNNDIDANSIGGAWSNKAMINLPYSYLPRNSDTSNSVTFSCVDSVDDGAIKVVHDAIEEKLIPPKYNYKNQALLNFAIKTSLVLPSDKNLYDRVYTYVHEQNALYHDNTVIKQPAVKAFACSNNVKYVPWRDRMIKTPYCTTADTSFPPRYFSTMIRRCLFL